MSLMKNFQLATFVVVHTVTSGVLAFWTYDVRAEVNAAVEVMKQIDKDSHLEALVPCQMADYDEAICVVTERNDTSPVNSPTRKLLIYEPTREGLKKLFEYGSDNPLLALHWIDASTILAIWETGSAKTITIFRLINKEFRVALELGTKFLPEIVDLDGDWSKEVLIAHTEKVVTDKQGRRLIIPTMASIYRFEKDTYRKTKEVPWKDRLKALP